MKCRCGNPQPVRESLIWFCANCKGLLPPRTIPDRPVRKKKAGRFYPRKKKP